MTAPTTSTSDRRFDNGRLIVDEDMAFDLLEMIENRRVLTLIIRADLRDAGFTEAAEHLTRRLNRLRYLRKRLDYLVADKGWGVPLPPPAPGRGR